MESGKGKEPQKIVLVFPPVFLGGDINDMDQQNDKSNQTDRGVKYDVAIHMDNYPSFGFVLV